MAVMVEPNTLSRCDVEGAPAEDNPLETDLGNGSLVPRESMRQRCWPAFVEMTGSIAGIATTIAFLPQVYEVRRTGDTSGLSLPMYCIFVGGVVMWMGYGALKGARSLVLANMITFIFAGYILAAIIGNVVFHSHREKALEGALLDVANTASDILPFVAVCASGSAHTFTHPRVHQGLEEVLLQPGWDLYAALDTRLSNSTTEDSSILQSLNAPSRLQAALSSLSTIDAVLYDAARCVASCMR